jgi:hypothetical protein
MKHSGSMTKIDAGLVELDDAFHFFNRSFQDLVRYNCCLFSFHTISSFAHRLILPREEELAHLQQTNSATPLTRPTTHSQSTKTSTTPPNNEMHPSTALLVTLLATLTIALPTAYSQSNTTNATIPTNFLLLTTPSPLQNTNTSSVNATSLFDPFSNPTYLLRLIGPGYGSLPRFNLTSDGKLETEASGPHGVGEFEYNSTRVRAGEDLMFSSTEIADEGKAKGNLGLKDGFLLTVGEEAVGWKVCDGELGQRVVSLLILSSFFRGRVLIVRLAGCLERRRRELHRHVCAGCAGCAVLSDLRLTSPASGLCTITGVR